MPMPAMPVYPRTNAPTPPPSGAAGNGEFSGDGREPADAGRAAYRVDATRFLVETLDGLAVVYDRRSTQTHVLANPMPEILAAMAGGSPKSRRGPADSATGSWTLAMLARDLGVDRSPATRARLAELLGDLVRIGVVDPVSACPIRELPAPETPTLEGKGQANPTEPSR